MDAADTATLRELGGRLAEIGNLPEQKQKLELWRRLNRLEPVRPMVLLLNGTWHENQHLIPCQCRDAWAHGLERLLRVQLFDAENVPDDTVHEPVLDSPVVHAHTGHGIHMDATQPDHVFGAKHFNTVLADDADPSVIPMPSLSLDHEATEREFQRRSEIFDGLLTVRKRGISGHWFAIMDQFIQWRGLDRTFLDLVDRPQWIHAWMERLTAYDLRLLDLYEEHNILGLNNGADRCGPGGHTTTDELPQPDFDGSHVRTVDQWGHATTQIFSEVSPAMLGAARWDLGEIRKSVRDVLEKTRGCAVEIIMKDLHTCRGEPGRMGDWARVAREEAQSFD